MYKAEFLNFFSVLPTCAKFRALEWSMDIYQSIRQGGYLLDLIVMTILVDMCVEWGSIDEICELFVRMSQRDGSQNQMVVGSEKNEFVNKSLENFKKVQLIRTKPNSKSLPASSQLVPKLEF